MLNLLNTFAAQIVTPCDLKGGSFLSFPSWYKYLNGIEDTNKACIPQIKALTDIWLIVAAVLDILLRFASILAIVIIIYGGVRFIMSQGEPDQTAKARETIFNALIGLVISVVAAFVVNFVAGQFS